ncbi:hypothetical protein EVAR_43728_1 [Eumeta japonica]|uniref:Uncharacterized protein n=1 Tax=Eumeta variegata TaxID=151549 RepID=A0A4C1Y1U4_EUMVA|nr:hypothetical protein EVAR_43728_1 [Eumeta japonica]
MRTNILTSESNSRTLPPLNNSMTGNRTRSYPLLKKSTSGPTPPRIDPHGSGDVDVSQVLARKADGEADRRADGPSAV